jgi:acetyl-CoA carboxylase beta subunit
MLVYQDTYTTCHLAGSNVTLNFHSLQAAGAIGQAQGESLQTALRALQAIDFQTLNLELNSAGAHFGEPMEGLFHLNDLEESLWHYRNRGIAIHVHCSGWLYGGMAMILASVAHEITLGEQAHMGLFGPKVLGNNNTGPVPALDLQPEHLHLSRLNDKGKP